MLIWSGSWLGASSEGPAPIEGMTSIARKPAGTASGGQFDTKVHDEPDVTLSGWSTVPVAVDLSVPSETYGGFDSRFDRDGVEAAYRHLVERSAREQVDSVRIHADGSVQCAVEDRDEVAAIDWGELKADADECLGAILQRYDMSDRDYWSPTPGPLVDGRARMGDAVRYSDIANQNMPVQRVAKVQREKVPTFGSDGSFVWVDGGRDEYVLESVTDGSVGGTNPLTGPGWRFVRPENDVAWAARSARVAKHAGSMADVPALVPMYDQTLVWRDGCVIAGPFTEFDDVAAAVRDAGFECAVTYGSNGIRL